MSANLLHAVKTAAAITDTATVLFSGGKDSVVTLDICRRYFKRINMAFMFYVPSLSFQERIIRYYEQLFNVECLRVPHFELSQFLRYGVFRPDDYSVPVVGTADVYNYIRELTGDYWISGGERINDSVVRRAMIKHSGSIDEKRGRFYPLAEWSKQDVLEYVRKNRLKVSEESAVLGYSFRSLSLDTIKAIKKHYPADFERIKAWFPLAEAQLYRGEINGET